MAADRTGSAPEALETPDTKNGKGKKVVTGKAVKPDKNEEPSPVPKGKKDAKGKTVGGDKEAELVREANKVKSQLLKHRSHARTLAEEIRRANKEWLWANNDQNVGELEQKIRDLEKALSTSTFATGFLIHDSKKMKDHAGSSFMVELEQFVLLLPLVGALQATCKTILQRSRCGAQSASV